MKNMNDFLINKGYCVKLKLVEDGESQQIDYPYLEATLPACVFGEDPSHPLKYQFVMTKDGNFVFAVDNDIVHKSEMPAYAVKSVSALLLKEGIGAGMPIVGLDLLTPEEGTEEPVFDELVSIINKDGFNKASRSLAEEYDMLEGYVALEEIFNHNDNEEEDD